MQIESLHGQNEFVYNHWWALQKKVSRDMFFIFYVHFAKALLLILLFSESFVYFLE